MINESQSSILCIAVGFFIFSVMIMSTASAAWWNPLPCTDECFDGQLKCRPDTTSAWKCGDYDTIFDFDSCREFPPESNQDAVQTCPYGCFPRESPTTDDPIGDACLIGDPCSQDAGTGCNPGDMRCGKKRKEGTSGTMPGDAIAASFMCKKVTRYGTEYDCYEWDMQDPNANECPFGCDAGSQEFPGSGMCLDQNQRDMSTCVAGITECDNSGFYVRECVDVDLDGSYHLEEDPNKMNYCPNGCARDFSIDGRAYCKDTDGKTDCNVCLFGGTRCNPNNDQYMQWCWESDLFGCSDWTTDYSGFVQKFGFGWHAEYGQYCDFGCHIDKCRANPDPDVPNIDACPFEGDTRCAGDKSYVAFCLPDPITGDLVWGAQTKCLSGKCVAGECVALTGKGFETITEGIPDDFELLTVFSMATDDRFFYITGLVNTGVQTNTLITLTTNASYVGHCFLNETEGGIPAGGGVTVWENNIYMQKNNSALVVLDGGCVNTSVIILDRNITAGARLTNNGTHFFINRGNVSNGMFVFNFDGEFQYPICLVEDSFTQCTEGQTDLANVEDKLYILHREDFDNDGRDDTPVIEIYGTNGYFFGNDNLTIPEGFSLETSNSGLVGIADIGDKLYMLWQKLVQINPAPSREFRSDLLLSVYFLDRACKNTCNEGGSHCVGKMKEYVADCVELPTGCFKYFDEVPDLFPETTFDDAMESCGATQCKEYWENHFILKAFCDDDISCEDVCELGQFSCDVNIDPSLTEDQAKVSEALINLFGGSKYRRECIRKSSPIPGNQGRECFGWADPSDNVFNEPDPYELCPQNHVCSNGECVPRPADCSLNESHCEIVGGIEYEVPCNNVSGILQWNWANRTTCSPWTCTETYNVTENKRTATCNAASLAELTASNQRNAVAEFEQWWNILWPDPFSQFFVIIIMSLAAFVILSPGGWQLSAGGATAVFVGHLATGWLGSIFLFAILLVLGILVLPKMIGGRDD